MAIGADLEECQDSRSKFIRPQYTLEGPAIQTRDTKTQALTTLPDLVEFNASNNPNHLFCIQYSHNTRVAPQRITYAELYRAVLCCSRWLTERGLSQSPTIQSGKNGKTRPVALLMASDVGWFIHFLALLRLGIPVLSMSARLSSQAVVHLLSETNAQAILISPQLQGLIDETLQVDDAAHTHPSVHQALTYHELLDDSNSLHVSGAPEMSRYPDTSDRNTVILHSSGTTGLPKPIFHSHGYLLGYAACHRLSHTDVEGSLNISTLPLYHGFGLLAPCLSLSVGMPVALLAATTIPTGASVSDILRSSGATSLMTVPSILDELYLLDNGVGVDSLKALRLVAVGGAPMKHSVARPLAEAGVALLNHWGVTEIGAIAPIFIPSPGDDWRYLRLRDDLGLRVEMIEGNGSGHCRLVGCPPGSEEEFVVQDLLTVNPNNPSSEFRIAGRADDIIVLDTGEKIRPTVLESTVSEDPLVKAALAFGDGRFQVGLIVEAATHVGLDLSNADSVANYVAQIWPSVAHANRITDAHAEVTEDMIVVTTPRARPLIRTPKGSIPREPNVEQFRDEIEAKYDGRSINCAENAGSLRLDDMGQLTDVIRREFQVSTSRIAHKIGDDDDFFERGMNSLQAAVLRKRLSQVMRQPLRTHGVTLPANLVYENPTVLRLAAALVQLCDGKPAPANLPVDRTVVMRSLVEEYARELSRLREKIELGSVPSNSQGHSHTVKVLLTGSTGSLGSSMLSELVKHPYVETVYALNRRGQRALRERQEENLKKLGIDLGDGWHKVVLLEADLAGKCFSLDDTEYNKLRTVTHIIHNAWPMDFNRKIDSFRQHFEAALNIIRLATGSLADQPVRILFSSSIAAVGRAGDVLGSSPGPVKEMPYPQPEVSEKYGYAEAKWVCERLFEDANSVFPDRIAATTIRLGQMSGCEATGAWSSAEHFPMLVKSCQAAGKIPDLPGHASWIPVNKAAIAMTEILLAKSPISAVMHLENPCRQPWFDITKTLGVLLKIPHEDRVSFAEWLELVKAHPDPVSNPSVKLVTFLEDSFIRIATGEVVLDTAISQNISNTLKTCENVSDQTLTRYVQYWQAEAFIA